MAEILFVRMRPLGSFYARRFSRVYPALFVFASAILLAGFAIGHADPTLAQYLSVITLTYNYAWFEFGRTSLLGHTWSLCVEEHMYLLLGLVAFFCRRYPRLGPVPVLATLAGCAVAVGVIQTALGMHYYEVYWRSDVRGASILMGATAFLALRRHVPTLLASPYAPLGLAIAGTLLNLDIVPDPVKYGLGTVCLAISLSLFHRAPRWALAILENRLILLFGTLSYSLYLWQQPFFKILPGFPERFMLLPLALVAAVLSYRLIERPARRLLNRWFHAPESRIAV
jgi:peptidoglycan/LPS O-acetylase OafA/YrhL